MSVRVDVGVCFGGIGGEAYVGFPADRKRYYGHHGSGERRLRRTHSNVVLNRSSCRTPRTVAAGVATGDCTAEWSAGTSSNPSAPPVPTSARHASTTPAIASSAYPCALTVGSIERKLAAMTLLWSRPTLASCLDAEASGRRFGKGGNGKRALWSQAELTTGTEGSLMRGTYNL